MFGRQVPVLGAVAAGGVIGAQARYGLSVLPGLGGDAGAGSSDNADIAGNSDIAGMAGFPWATLVANVTGCLLIGVLMALIAEMAAPHPLLRPFVGVGVLGGYTTFSAYAVETHQMLVDDRFVAAGGYLVATPVTALAAVWCGIRLTRAWRARRVSGG
ncbi:CrcB family protein [Actinobacteria bacterium YIM 96077]|uniref:Fluoride-specific ion channel FluC n=1 Tax=Phytoactinopolyspora halophila TaxID=1981511 RepID=A0A329QAP8_9ACTN|nr:CrcB family protein [Phytoactinopolyspora halophila]AYY13739.1 CrcB family protein [Actinobacteria bacterium YIM 96077]RAW09470.1 hypothetical protein DPM12_21070 [Phytoactinopolyspora halophila]